MRHGTFPKAELLARLRANRDQHRDLFERAIAAYRQAAIVQLDQQIQRLRDGMTDTVLVRIEAPEDHTGDYDRAIAMIEFDVENVVTLDERQFAELVLDDWGWKNQFLHSTSHYLDQ